MPVPLFPPPQKLHLARPSGRINGSASPFWQKLSNGVREKPVLPRAGTRRLVSAGQRGPTAILSILFIHVQMGV